MVTNVLGKLELEMVESINKIKSLSYNQRQKIIVEADKRVNKEIPEDIYRKADKLVEELKTDRTIYRETNLPYDKDIGNLFAAAAAERLLSYYAHESN